MLKKLNSIIDNNETLKNVAYKFGRAYIIYMMIYIPAAIIVLATMYFKRKKEEREITEDNIE